MAKIPKVKSQAEETVWQWLRFTFPDAGFVREHRFHPKRKWRFDFASPGLMLAIEVEGISHSRLTGHTSVKGYSADCEKYNAAAMLGWMLIRGTQPMIKSGRFYSDIEHALRACRNDPRIA